MDTFRLFIALEANLPDATQEELDAHFSHITSLCRFYEDVDSIIEAIITSCCAAAWCAEIRDGKDGWHRLKNRLEIHAKALGHANHRHDIKQRTKAIDKS